MKFKKVYILFSGKSTLFLVKYTIDTKVVNKRVQAITVIHICILSLLL